LISNDKVMSFDYTYDPHGALICIRGKYKHKLTDMNRIHEDVTNLILYQQKQNQELRNTIDQQNLTSKTMSMLGSMKRLERAHLRYLSEAGELVRQYNQLSNKQQVVDFSSKSTVHTDCENDLFEQLTIGQTYIEIVKSIVNTVDVVQEIDDISISCCVICSCFISEDAETVDNLRVCPGCGYVKNSPIDKDYGTSSKSGYMDSENFQKILAKYEGLITLDDTQMETLMIQLDEYFVSYGKATGDEVRRRPLNKFGWKDGTGYELMNQALQAIKMPIYDCVSSICARYWGFKLPDISGVKKQVLEDYVNSQPVFQDIIKKYPDLRSSSLNTRFRAFKHLEARGANVREEEFRIIKTHDIRVMHEKIWWCMCKRTGIPYIPSV
jgi:hypothetical protein